jgi:hypothetical protein
MKTKKLTPLLLVLTALSSCMKEDNITPDPVITEEGGGNDYYFPSIVEY